MTNLCHRPAVCIAGQRFIFMDVPLLFEVKALQFVCSKIICVYWYGTARCLLRIVLLMFLVCLC